MSGTITATLLGIITATLVAASPLIAGALGGMYSEKSGVINIGIEGIMTFAAFSCSVGIIIMEEVVHLNSPIVLLVGLLFGIVGGCLFALLHAYLCVTLKIDQTIAGTVINIVTLGLAVFLTTSIFRSSSSPAKMTPNIRFLGIPVIVYFIILLIFISYVILNKSKWGLHVKACGENPQAAEAMGINVTKTRYQAVLMTGVFAGIAGATIVLISTGNFSGTVVAGKGFIAIAVLIFGRWSPFGILGSGLLFGFFTALGTIVPISFPNFPVPGIYFQILPYIVTIIALIIFSKSDFSPKALGKVYVKNSR